MKKLKIVEFLLKFWRDIILKKDNQSHDIERRQTVSLIKVSRSENLRT